MVGGLEEVGGGKGGWREAGQVVLVPALVASHEGFTFPLQSLRHTPNDNCCCQVELLYLPLKASIEVPHGCLWLGLVFLHLSSTLGLFLQVSYSLGQAMVPPLMWAKLKLR